MKRALGLDRKSDGDAGAADLLAQIARLDLAAFGDFDWRDIGADRAQIVGNGFREQRPRLVVASNNRRIRKLSRPALLSGAVDDRAVPGSVGGHDRGAGDADFFLLER